MRDIILINNFCRDFSKNDNGRFMYLCKELSKNNKVEIITNDFNHATKTHKEPLREEWPFKIIFLHEPGYKKNVSVRRFYSHYIWGKAVYRYLCARRKPDVIYCNVPSLTAALKASDYCLYNKVRFIIDIQDLWPEAFKMVLNIPVLSDIIFYPFKKIADKIYCRADDVCAVSKSFVERALRINKKCVSGHVIYIGTSLATFDDGALNAPHIKKEETEQWLGYCGTLAASYDIPCVIDALNILNSKGIETPKFIIVGDGERKKNFESYAKEKNVKAVFTGWVEYNQMCAILSQCDMVINPIKNRSAASIINKHSDYASSGLPVINTQNSKEYRELIDEYHMGLNCENNNANDVAEKIQFLLEHPNEAKLMGKNARKCAEEKFDRENSYKELIATILG